MKIAIQGGQASFHDLATRQYFTDTAVELHECNTFRQVCKALVEKRVHLAVLAIENTLGGSILPNYSLLLEYPLYIIGEIYLHIKQNLMALPGQTLSEIRVVRSHPMSFLQCSEFLEKHPHIEAVASLDTAESAREIRVKQSRGVAAIASRLAAELYGLDILAAAIENFKQNYTRFLILSNEENRNVETADKASINFHLKHQVGALADVLDVFRQHAINLTLIQSIPIPGQPNEYAFHVDLEWDDKKAFDAALNQVIFLCQDLRVLGIYKKGEIRNDY